MKRTSSYFLQHWMIFFVATVILLFVLTFLVFFAMMFLQVTAEPLSLKLMFYWVWIRTLTLLFIMSSAIFFLSIIATIFYFEQNGEMRGFYLVGQNLFSVVGVLRIVAILFSLAQVLLSHTRYPSWQQTNRRLEDLYTPTTKTTQQDFFWSDEDYIVSIKYYNIERKEIRGIQLIAINPHNRETSNWLWMDGNYAHWLDEQWVISDVRFLDRDKVWSTHQKFSLTEDILPTPSFLEELSMKSKWNEHTTSELRAYLSADDATSQLISRHILFIIGTRYLNSILIVFVFMQLYYYDPSKRFMLLRLTFRFLLYFTLFLIGQWWAKTWIEYTEIAWYIALGIPYGIIFIYYAFLWTTLIAMKVRRRALTE
ncbi:LptF/LptG family permease [Entomospira entomophila]|uniref:LptF/LptG family permease n=1 Tax=Entomospira entomophila TaxID=2719988 RepID=A0A968GCL3_9SPIO|nr:LptF/LptG family permease [Entomospira entomophilus]NIZ41153.1 LptF/LptG family permease [Entomospira entomophilus]WDI35360.1 LptF/LptG family permease [Entomospira entomophilus]